VTEPPTYLLDVNVLVALAWPNHLHHSRAQRWLGGVERWATTPVTESALVRLSLNPAVAGRRVSLSEAATLLRAVRQAPGHQFIIDSSSLADSSIDLRRIATSAQVTDAHLVGLAAANGVVLATMDAGIPAMLEPADRHHVLVLPA
jgi:uncharacterized protein